MQNGLKKRMNGTGPEKGGWPGNGEDNRDGRRYLES